MPEQLTLQPAIWRVTTSEDGKTFERSEPYTIAEAMEIEHMLNEQGKTAWLTLDLGEICQNPA